MNNGDISNKPANTVYIDADSLFEFSEYGMQDNVRFIQKVCSLMMEYIVVIVFISGRTKVNYRHVKKSQFLYDRYEIMPPEKAKKFFRGEKRILVCKERQPLYQTNYVSIEHSLDKIKGELWRRR